MKLGALVGVDREPEAFASLFAAARGAGRRVGWLDLAASAEAPAPPELTRAAELGARRAVAVAPGRTVAVKPVAGPFVLRDLVREHFLGCAIVLVRGLEGWPRLEPAGSLYELRTAADRRLTLDAEGLVAELVRPRNRAPERKR